MLFISQCKCSCVFRYTMLSQLVDCPSSKLSQWEKHAYVLRPEAPTHTHTHAHTYSIHIHAYTRTYTHKRTHTRTHARTHTNASSHVRQGTSSQSRAHSPSWQHPRYQPPLPHRGQIWCYHWSIRQIGPAPDWRHRYVVATTLRWCP